MSDKQPQDQDQEQAKDQDQEQENDRDQLKDKNQEGNDVGTEEQQDQWPTADYAKEQEDELAGQTTEEAYAGATSEKQGKAGHWLSTSGLPWALTGLLALVIVVLLIYMEPSGQSQTVAKVNDEPITIDQMHEAVVAQFGPQGVDQVIEQLITEELIRQAAEAAGVQLTDDDIESELAKVREQFPSEQQYHDTLNQVGLTEDKLKEQMQSQVLLDKMLASEVQVTDAQVSELFEQRKQELTDPERIRASHILVGTREEAEQILDEFQAGAEFAALAAEHSTDGSAMQGGDLGYFGHGDMVLPFEEAAFALEQGELSGIVETQYGFHLIKVTDVPRNWTLEDKQEELQLELEQQELGMKRTQWLSASRDAAKIEKLY